MKVLRGLHKVRLIELDEPIGGMQILPPGTKKVQDILQRKRILPV